MKLSDPITYDQEARRAWATPYFADVADRPIYGSSEWAALPDDDRRKIAAVVVAAECWATDRDELSQRLRAELEASRETAQAEWDEWRAANRPAITEANKRVVHSLLNPSMVELGRRLSMNEAERVAEARRARPGDRPREPIHASLTTSQSGEAA
ncbi:DUF2742 domain-containing protein [Kribbella sp. NBC_01245]|uniref:DUF2742 domain-containing protein n=1 Tax=Kribbella sp. NBC_01245 TaxID=2903578 RepID=UPI002E2BAB21|nr:DUF2742 domain-containing protein [Kribbella sp. NBC_01245]